MASSVLKNSFDFSESPMKKKLFVCGFVALLVILQAFNKKYVLSQIILQKRSSIFFSNVTI